MAATHGWLSRDAHELQRELQRRQPTAQDTGDTSAVAGADADAPGTPPSDQDCDILIVGSGYGGAVAAARLAGLQSPDGQPLRVWLLERGREYLPGMFPSTAAELPGHVKLSRQNGQRPLGNAAALWDVRLGPDVTVVLGSGLGGGSLINAAVMERPEPEIWQHGWPAGVDAQTLEPHFGTVLSQLQAAPLPGHLNPPKLAALQRLGNALPGRPTVRRCDIAISFGETPTPGAGVARRACTQCGDCTTGCNAQAKNSLDSNYLALARQRGATVFCGTLALRVRPVPGGWELDWAPTDDKLPWAKQALPIRTRRLLICAGSLGSTELLLRSRAAGLSVSPALGSRFSGNGDMIAAAVDVPVATRICGDETTPATVPERSRGIGPTITGMLRTGQGSGRFAIEEFAIPAPLRAALGELTGSLGLLHGLLRHDFSLHHPFQRGDEPLSPGTRAMDHSMVYGLMGDDGARGRIELKPPFDDDAAAAAAGWDGQVAVHWPRGRHEAVYEAQHRALRQALSHRSVGHYLPNPLWRPLPDELDRLVNADGLRGPLTTVHPLGGCPMADDAEHGVVDRWGRVFDPRFDPSGPRVHDGLAVIDGAAIPRALGINPALTIAAWAEFAVAGLKAQWNLSDAPLDAMPDTPAFDPTRRPVWATPAGRPRQLPTRARIREQLHGSLVLDGRRYWAELQVRFSPIDDIAAVARQLPREVGLEHAVLRLFEDRDGRVDEPSWLAQRTVEPEPLFEVILSGHAKVLHRQASTWVDRMARVWWATRGDGAGRDSGLPLWTQMAIASRLGERRTIDYLLHVDRASSPLCPLQPGELLRGRKVLAFDRKANPWRQLSEMVVARRRSSWGVPRFEAAGSVALDLKHFVQQRVALLELLEAPDMVTALADLGVFGLFAMRLALKVQLLTFMPPRKTERPITLRRPGPLPGLSMERHDLRRQSGYGWVGTAWHGQPLKALLTRYRWALDATEPTPILLVHGFTASGSSYAHPSLPDNLVQALCRERRDVWVAELPTSIAFDKRDVQDLSFEDVADQIPVLVRYVRECTGASRVDLLGHCIGAAMSVRALLRSEELGRQVRAVVLSQVGPLIQMSPSNLLRGYVASYLSRFLGAQTLDARPSASSGTVAGLGQLLLDAALASLPYPRDDREGDWARQAEHEGRPDFRLVRHRSDAMLGQIFELSEHSAPTEPMLDALDDILGYARVRTLAQVIHYGRLEMLSDPDGTNREIREETAVQRLPRHILLLHGRRSGVFDWRGSLQSWEWLERCLPGGPPAHTRVERDGERLHLGVGAPRQLCVFERFGHQDCIVGTRAPAVVFPVINRFLRELPAGEAGDEPPLSAPVPGWAACVPEFGPVLGRLVDDGTQLYAAVLVHPSQRQARVRFLALVPVTQARGRWERAGPVQLKQWLGPLPGRGRPGPDDADYLGERLRAGAFTMGLGPCARAKAQESAWLVLTVHNGLSRRASLTHAAPREQQSLAEAAIDRLLQRPRAEWEPALLRLSPSVIAGSERRGAGHESADELPTRLCLALASCQYSAGLLDQALAGESYRRLGARLDGLSRHPGAGLPAPQLLLMVGDQVYVDETAGVFDPPPHEAATTETYRRAWGLPAFRRMASRLQTLMIGDDHEVADNWQPGWTQGVEAARQAQAVHQGSLLTGQAAPAAAPADFSARLAPAGFALYLLDTRSTREIRRPDNVDRAAIVNEARMADLLAWLDELSQRDRYGPKLLVSPVVLLPLERRLNAEPAYASDAWAGYPASRARLLRHIADRGIHNVILLSGDVHLSMAGEFELRRHGQAPAIRVFSVVSSGTYAPWRFANQQPEDFCLAGQAATPGPWVEIAPDGLQVRALRTHAHTANGFAVLQVDRARPMLEVELDLGDGLRSMAFDLDGP